jgi:RNA polymerase sigma-70 factor (ECF subfamily)
VIASDDKEKQTWNEKTLVRRLKRGDEDAFRALIGRYKHKIYGIALGITLDKEESLDIVQDVLTKVYEKIETFKGDARLSTWIHRITVNHCLNWKRKWKRRFRWRHQSLDQEESGKIPELGSEDYVPDALYQSETLKKHLWASLRALPSETRAVFVLKEFEGLSYEDIADTLGIKKGTVSSRLYSARKQLRHALGPYLKGEESPS